MQIEEVNMDTRSTQGTVETDKYYIQALLVPLSLSLQVQCA